MINELLLIPWLGLGGLLLPAGLLGLALYLRRKVFFRRKLALWCSLGLVFGGVVCLIPAIKGYHILIEQEQLLATQ